MKYRVVLRVTNMGQSLLNKIYYVDLLLNGKLSMEIDNRNGVNHFFPT